MEECIVLVGMYISNEAVVHVLEQHFDVEVPVFNEDDDDHLNNTVVEFADQPLPGTKLIFHSVRNTGHFPCGSPEEPDNAIGFPLTAQFNDQGNFERVTWDLNDMTALFSDVTHELIRVGLDGPVKLMIIGVSG
jgi:hypothetical protein